MTTIKGVYENGQIKLLETPPVKSSNKVLVTFIDDDSEQIRKITLDRSSKEFSQYLNDSREDLYQVTPTPKEVKKKEDRRYCLVPNSLT